MTEIQKGEGPETPARVLLAWVTNPMAAERIAATGRRMAEENHCDLMIVSIQGAIRDNWADTVQDLEQLHEAARGVQADLTVVYSDNRLEAAVKLIRKTKPLLMIAGVPGNLGRNLFLEHIRAGDPSIPIYTVDSSGNTVRLL